MRVTEAQRRALRLMSAGTKWTHRDDMPGVGARTLLVVERLGLASCRPAGLTFRYPDDVFRSDRRTLQCTLWRLTPKGRRLLYGSSASRSSS